MPKGLKNIEKLIEDTDVTLDEFSPEDLNEAILQVSEGRKKKVEEEEDEYGNDFGDDDKTAEDEDDMEGDGKKKKVSEAKRKMKEEEDEEDSDEDDDEEDSDEDDDDEDSDSEDDDDDDDDEDEDLDENFNLIKGFEDDDFELVVPKVTRDSIKVNEDLAKIFGKDNQLTEEFKNKVETIYSATVVSKINETLETVVEQLKNKYIEDRDEKFATIDETVSDYLSVVVEDWKRDNEIEVASKVKQEMSESILNGIRRVFEEHYINLDEDNADVVEELVNKVETLESKLNESYETNVKMKKVLNKVERNLIVLDEVQDLTDSQKEKIMELSETVKFRNEEDFRSRINDLVETYIDEDTYDFDIDSDDEPISLEEEVKSNKGNPIINGLTKALDEMV